MANKNIFTINSKKSNFVWININNAQKGEIDYLKKKFKFDELDLKDTYAANYAQRPKFVVRNNYSFLILQFPIYDRQTRKVEPEEINFFIGPNYIITSHNNLLPPLADFFNLCQSDKFYMDQYLGEDKMMLLYEIISRLQEYCYPIMDHLSLDITTIEKNIFLGKEKSMVKEILLIKRNVLNFRKMMEAHKNVIQKLTASKVGYLDARQMKAYYGDLIDNTKNIWDIVNGQKEMIEALENTNSSLISFKLNDVMRLLTIFSVIILPLTLLACIFSMNTVNAMPFLNDPDGFWIIIESMAGLALLMIIYFKIRKWL